MRSKSRRAQMIALQEAKDQEVPTQDMLRSFLRRRRDYWLRNLK